jgi:type IV secretory pathway VirB3-like protein
VSLQPVYKSLNRPLTIWGAERRLFFLALMLGAGVFNFFGSVVGGLVVFGTLTVAARWITVTDRQLLRIVANAGNRCPQYDAITFHPVTVRRRPQ